MTISGISTFVITSNRLVGEYLVGILANNQFAHPILCEHLPRPRLRSVPSIFVIEGSQIPLPLRECIRQLSSLFPKGKFVIVHAPQPDEEIIFLMRLGVQGFVEYPTVAKCLAKAVRTVAAGRLWVRSELMEKYVSLTTVAKQCCGEKSPLPTQRESEVLELVRRRLSNKEIANLLDISESTVKYHISHILCKLKAGNRRELETTARLVQGQIWDQMSKVKTSRHSQV